MAKSSSVTKSNRSGGPRTDEGKKIASSNAVKTGAYSNTLILPGEDESQFRQIEDQFARDFRPEDMTEIAMVRDLAYCFGYICVSKICRYGSYWFATLWRPD